ncbi:hypothetical protein F3Y22_tig00002193pilonHSYRG00255 [Hibiscus syriacus]|uniref:Uncharacterized protein n=1 Tax=Hibiscus syriacus TaxID=106335 RepID=A0A6A3CTN8_HIBSY|nr:hypothetical protein F3Y22_tig00002193pilonHSYRG00255 [Hibiscus syriacus]
MSLLITVFLTCYCHNGLADEGITTFIQILENEHPNEFTLVVETYVTNGHFTELQQSSVFVLDPSFYKEESSLSPVKKGSINFKEDDTWSSSVISSDESKSEDKSDVCDFIYTSDSSRTEESIGTSDSSRTEGGVITFDSSRTEGGIDTSDSSRTERGIGTSDSSRTEEGIGTSDSSQTE